jgi:hypothetical protein
METLIRLPELGFTLEKSAPVIAVPLYVMNALFPENSLEPPACRVNVTRNGGRETKGDLSSKDAV